MMDKCCQNELAQFRCYSGYLLDELQNACTYLLGEMQYCAICVFEEVQKSCRWVLQVRQNRCQILLQQIKSVDSSQTGEKFFQRHLESAMDEIQTFRVAEMENCRTSLQDELSKCASDLQDEMDTCSNDILMEILQFTSRRDESCCSNRLKEIKICCRNLLEEMQQLCHLSLENLRKRATSLTEQQQSFCQLLLSQMEDDCERNLIGLDEKRVELRDDEGFDVLERTQTRCGKVTIDIQSCCATIVEELQVHSRGLREQLLLCHSCHTYM